MQQLTSCLVCEGSRLRPLYRSTFHGTVNEAHEYFLARRKFTAHGDIQKCRDCGFAFTNPQFSEEEYTQVYSRIAENGAAAERADVAAANKAASRARLLRLKAAIGRYADIDQPFIDFGCGDGEFLSVMGSTSGMGFEVGAAGEGTGPSGARIVTGIWPETAGSPMVPWGSQAFVTAFDVFEHLPQLTRDVDLIRRVLRPSGLLFVTVPDIGSWMARLAGARWNMLLLEHLWYFRAETLGRLMRRLGFSALEHGAVPYDASLAHVAKRLGESLGWAPPLPRSLRSRVLPIPAGVLFGVYQRMD